MSILASMRRRRRAVARVVLPLVVTVWFSASASPCLGMTLGSGHAAHTDAAALTHDHVRADHQADHQPDQRHEVPAHHHGSCPHCPSGPSSQGDQAAASHIPCSALDDVSNNGGQSSVLKWQLKHFLPPADFVSSSASVYRPPAHGVPRAARPAYSSVSLNLRHCVFLI